MTCNEYGTPQIDPLGPTATDEAVVTDDGAARRVVRGGSWIDCACWARSARRAEAPPGYYYQDLGFRLCLSTYYP